jgi:branched-chain amino acid aminotransferase
MSDLPDSSPPVAWHDGQFVNASELRISLDDVGFRQGVVAVERMRTYGGKVSALEPHIVRWRRTLEELYLAIPVDLDQIRERVESLLERNRDWLSIAGDCGIVMLATPGTAQPAGGCSTPNEILHLMPISHHKVERHRTLGQPVFVTDVEQPSGKCWPRDIKVRCRLHYYLADMQAREHHPDAVGLLIDHDGTVTETSVANLAIVRRGKIFSPPVDQVLPGVTQQLVREACQRVGFEWCEERLWPSEVRDADEVWLMGTDGGLWFANRVDGHPIQREKPGPSYQRVQDAFSQMVSAC